MTKKQRKPAAFDIEESEDELLPLDFADSGDEALPVQGNRLNAIAG